MCFYGAISLIANSASSAGQAQDFGRNISPLIKCIQNRPGEKGRELEIIHSSAAAKEGQQDLAVSPK